MGTTQNCRPPPLFGPFQGHALIGIIFLFLFYRLCDANGIKVEVDEDVRPRPVQYKISDQSMRNYQKYNEETCRKTDQHSYWDWEENTFLRELRVTLLPETAHGDYQGIVTNEYYKYIDHRMLNTGERSLCPKKNKTGESQKDVATLLEKQAFEDEVVDFIFNMEDAAPNKIG